MASQRSDHRAGIVPGMAHLALDLVDRGQGTAIGFVQDARTEVRVIVESGIELSEKTAASLFRIARKLTQRVDEAVAESLMATERLLGGALKSARETTRAVSDLANTAIDGIAGQRAASAVTSDVRTS